MAKAMTPMTTFLARMGALTAESGAVASARAFCRDMITSSLKGDGRPSGRPSGKTCRCLGGSQLSALHHFIARGMYAADRMLHDVWGDERVHRERFQREHNFVGVFLVAVVFRNAEAGAKAHPGRVLNVDLLAGAVPFEQQVADRLGQMVVLDQIGASPRIRQFFCVLNPGVDSLGIDAV